MIPEFPNFKKLELTDRKDVENFTSKFPPYSDFNFVSLWSWNIKDEMRLSILNDNLVVHFTDYLTGKLFYSFLGNNDVNGTVEKLMEISKQEGIELKLKLVPEDSIKGLDLNKFKAEEDRDNFDYIYSTEKLTKMSGSEHSNSRRLVRNFLKKNNEIMVENLDLMVIKNRMEVLKLDYSWKVNKELNFNNENEEKALIRLLNSAESLSLTNIGVFIDGELVAFTINEKLNDNYVISLFAKFNTIYRGSYLYSMKATAEKLLKEKYKYVNCEQDLGLSGLRFSKEALRPVFYLKKYKIKSYTSTVSPLP